MNNLHILGNKNSLFNEFIAEVRNVEVQTDSMRFRRNLERIGEIFAYEISKVMKYSEQEVVTPLGIANIPRLQEKPVLATILRAGLPLHQGFLNFFDHADNAFISAFRKYYKDGTFEIQIDYLSSPDLDDKTLILCDPMLATGGSACDAIDLLKKRGCKHIKFMAIIGAPEGVSRVAEAHPDVKIYVSTLDRCLNDKGYILPGLGDAGDRLFGTK